jgi:dephospho-CoA kinase
VENSRKKLIIGILGGVASGKSTVAAEFVKLGCKIIDADRIAHELLERKDVKEKVVSVFGEGILDSASKIDRRKLGDIVFANGDKLASLNKIIHRPVLARAEQLIEQYNEENQAKAIVLDMPLLVEVGWAERCDKLVFVDCRHQLRVDRAKKIGIMTENQLKIRENFQISLDSKAGIADNTVDNNSDLSGLAKQIADIFSHIVNME